MIEDPDGNELKILRDNMPFGSVAAGEFGTYYIAYAATPDVPELMLRRMFLGDPYGTYDRILDFSTADDRLPLLRARPATSWTTCPTRRSVSDSEQRRSGRPAWRC